MLAGAPPVLTIRNARRDDIPALNAMIARSARMLGADYYRDEQIEAAIAHVFGVDSRLIDDGTYFCVDGPDGFILACGGWSRRATLFGGDQASGRMDRALDPASEAARIRAFFVAPEAAGQGLGRRLLDHCIAAARAEGFAALELMATLSGVDFYARQGFEAGPRQTFFYDGIDVGFVPMRRAITE